MNVNLVDDATLTLMKSAGCHMIELGVESGDDHILKAMKKNITSEQALNACKLIKKHGIELQAYIIAGYPQETEETLQRTMEFLRKINCNICFSIFSPFPGTEIYELCKEKKLIEDDYDISLHNFQNLDSFCLNISRDRFKELILPMIREIDKMNKRYKISRVFSANTLWRIREMGLGGAVRKGFRVFSGKN
jgi:radical SAM superfamily enzyme YgiQ (UPF0313 family)